MDHPKPSSRDLISALVDAARDEDARRIAELTRERDRLAAALPCDPNARQWLLELWRLLDMPSQVSAVAEVKRLQNFERRVRAATEVSP